jgi:plasmid stability protein
LSSDTVDRLKRRAARRGRSLQAELREILERSADVDLADASQVAARIRDALAGREHSDSAELLAQDRRR